MPFELALSASEAVLGTVQAPDAFSVRLTGRVFVDPRRFRALLPGRPDSVIPPPDAPLDTLPSQVRPDSVPADAPDPDAPRPSVEEAPPTPPAPPPAPPASPPATAPTQRPPGNESVDSADADAADRPRGSD